MIRVIHKDCGKVAFYFKKKLEKGDLIESSNVILIDKTPAIYGSDIICGSCHKSVKLNRNHIDQEHWSDWFIIEKHL